MSGPESSVASFEIEIARCKAQENGLKLALALTLSPRRGNNHRTIQFFREQLRRIQYLAFQKDGERFSLSPGERAGVGASVPSYL
jgi:hypothetical protein